MRLNKENPLVVKYLEILTLGTKVGFAQIVIQGVGFITGILIIRTLPQEKFALYTLAYTFLGTMSVLADGGIGNGVMAQGGKVWTDPLRLGGVLSTGLALRRRFAAAAMILAMPLLAYALRTHDASWAEIFFLELAILPLFYVQLSESLLSIVPRLHQNIDAIQGISIRTNVLRLALILLTLLLTPYAAAVIFATGIASAWGNHRLAKLTAKLCHIEKTEDAQVRSELLVIVRRSMPGAIYYCLSGSLSIWLITVFGATQSIAEVGALDRVGRLIMLCTVFMSFIITPRFARLPEISSLLRARFLQTLALTLAIGGAVVGVFLLAPGPILSLLGPEYADLKSEVIIMSMVMAANFVSTAIGSLASSRGWIPPPFRMILLQVSSQVAGIMLFDCSTVFGVLMVSLLTPLILIPTLGFYTIHVIKKIDQS